MPDEQPEIRASVHWKPYAIPSNYHDREECARVDAVNKARLAHNTTQLDAVNAVLRAIGTQERKTTPAPPMYYDGAHRHWRTQIDEPLAKQGLAVTYLWEKQKRLPFRDYAYAEAATLADTHATQAEMARLLGGGGVDITKILPPAEKHRCESRGRWDGRRERCCAAAGSIRIGWHQDERHHFLDPRVDPRAY